MAFKRVDVGDAGFSEGLDSQLTVLDLEYELHEIAESGIWLSVRGWINGRMTRGKDLPFDGTLLVEAGDRLGPVHDLNVYGLPWCVGGVVPMEHLAMTVQLALDAREREAVAELLSGRVWP